MPALTASADSITAPTNPLRRYPILSYFVIAYGFTWVWVLVFLVGLHIPLNTWTNVLVILGPSVGGFVMTYVMEGRAGIIRFLHRFILWRVSVLWYLVILIGPPLLFNLGLAVLPGALATFQLPPADQVLSFPGFAVLVLVLGGPLLEEPGWRGFALPRMQARFGPLVATLFLGVLWCVWHFPLFLVPVWSAQNGGFTLESVSLYLGGVISFTVLFTWVFNHTRGSLLLAILLHTVINAMSVFTMFTADPSLGGLIGFGVAALILIAVTRGRLGYDTYLRETAVSAF